MIPVTEADRLPETGQMREDSRARTARRRNFLAEKEYGQSTEGTSGYLVLTRSDRNRGFLYPVRHLGRVDRAQRCEGPFFGIIRRNPITRERFLGYRTTGPRSWAVGRRYRLATRSPRPWPRSHPFHEHFPAVRLGPWKVRPLPKFTTCGPGRRFGWNC